jgi:hypothetical protein
MASGVLVQHDELVSAEPTERIRGACCFNEPVCHGDQEAVAGAVALVATTFVV